LASFEKQKHIADRTANCDLKLGWSHPKYPAGNVPLITRDRVPGGSMPLCVGGDYLIFGDIQGKLDTLRVECTKCARKGRYSVRRLIEKYGRKANMMKWKEQLNGDCPKRDAHSMLERCDLICPDLPKVL
jgi:hypothetical protein